MSKWLTEEVGANRISHFQLFTYETKIFKFFKTFLAFSLLCFVLDEIGRIFGKLGVQVIPSETRLQINDWWWMFAFQVAALRERRSIIQNSYERPLSVRREMNTENESFTPTRSSYSGTGQFLWCFIDFCVHKMNRRIYSTIEPCDVRRFVTFCVSRLSVGRNPHWTLCSINISRVFMHRVFFRGKLRRIFTRNLLEILKLAVGRHIVGLYSEAWQTCRVTLLPRCSIWTSMFRWNSEGYWSMILSLNV